MTGAGRALLEDPGLELSRTPIVGVGGTWVRSADLHRGVARGDRGVDLRGGQATVSRHKHLDDQLTCDRPPPPRRRDYQAGCKIP